MFGIPSPRADDRAAMACEDLASALEAGIPPDHLGAPQGAQEDWVVAALGARGVPLTAAERLMLEAAARSGSLDRTLRQRAEARRLRAEIVRQCLAGLRYPLVLLVVTLLVSVLVASAMRSILPAIVVGMAVAALVALIAGCGLSLNRPRGLVHRIPGLADLLRDIGELPYLQTLHGLYAAGVPLRDAHPQAAAASPVAFVRERLRTADPILQAGAPLTEALQRSAALHLESQTLLATGERAGDLEDALRRAAIRRGDVLRRRAEQLARVLSVAVYVFAAAVAIYLIFSFYSGYLSRGWSR